MSVQIAMGSSENPERVKMSYCNEIWIFATQIFQMGALQNAFRWKGNLKI